MTPSIDYHIILIFLTDSASLIARLLLLLAIFHALYHNSYHLKRRAFFILCSYLTVMFITFFLTNNHPGHPSLLTMEVFVIATSFFFAFRVNLLSFSVYCWACLVACSRFLISDHSIIDILFAIIIATLVPVFWYWGLIAPSHTEMHDL